MNISYDDIKKYVSNCETVEEAALAIKFYNISKKNINQIDVINLIDIKTAVNRINLEYEKVENKSINLKANYFLMKKLYNNFQINNKEGISSLLEIITIMEGYLNLSISFPSYTEKYLKKVINKNGKTKKKSM